MTNLTTEALRHNVLQRIKGTFGIWLRKGFTAEEIIDQFLDRSLVEQAAVEAALPADACQNSPDNNDVICGISKKQHGPGACKCIRYIAPTFDLGRAKQLVEQLGYKQAGLHIYPGMSVSRRREMLKQVPPRTERMFLVTCMAAYPGFRVSYTDAIAMPAEELDNYVVYVELVLGVIRLE